MEEAVEVFVAVNFLIIGFSHLLQADVWVEFFKILKGYGKAGSFANGFISITFGSIIVAFHWVWEGVIPSIVTAFGIAQVIKSLLLLVMPKVGLHSMSRPQAENPWSYRIGGLIFIVFGVVLIYRILNTEY